MGKSILILGALSDIGRAVAHRYAQEGYDVYLAARQASRLQADQEDLKIRYGVSAHCFEFDALDQPAHATFFSSLPETPEVVCCVFGYMPPQAEAEKDWAKANQVLQTNYVGAVSILEKAQAAILATGEKGLIIGISSVAGDRGRGSNAFYCSAKAGFTAYLSGLRNRLVKTPVHVLTVKPGYVKTAMTEHMELPGPLTASPEEVASALFKAGRKKKNILYVRWMWRYIMLIIRMIPEPIFKKLSL
ncbi:MAG: SDR family oxidoreductase [Bacteroidota bacterium]